MSAKKSIAIDLKKSQLAIRKAINDFKILKKPKKVLIACSGGADSLALALVAFSIFKENLGIIIVDHSIQKNSNKIATDTKSKLENFGIKNIYIKQVKIVQKVNLEANARDARYQALKEAALFFKADFVLLAHTQNDQAETVLLNLTRKSGLSSIAGMPKERDIYYRPLLETITRKQTEQACEFYGVKPYIDLTNFPNKTPYFSLRAEFRHNIIPLINKTAKTDIKLNLVKTAIQVRKDLQALDLVSEQFCKTLLNYASNENKIIKLNTKKLIDLKLPEAIRKRILKKFLILWGCEPENIAQKHIDTIDYMLLKTQITTSKEVIVQNGICIKKVGDFLVKKEKKVVSNGSS